MDCYKDVKGTIYDYDAFTLNGKEHIQFKQYAGKHVLFVLILDRALNSGFLSLSS